MVLVFASWEHQRSNGFRKRNANQADHHRRGKADAQADEGSDPHDLERVIKNEGVQKRYQSVEPRHAQGSENQGDEIRDGVPFQRFPLLLEKRGDKPDHKSAYPGNQHPQRGS